MEAGVAEAARLFEGTPDTSAWMVGRFDDQTIVCIGQEKSTEQHMMIAKDEWRSTQSSSKRIKGAWFFPLYPRGVVCDQHKPMVNVVPYLPFNPHAPTASPERLSSPQKLLL